MFRNLVPFFIKKNLSEGKQSGSFFCYIISGDICGFTPLVESLMKKEKEGAELLGRILNDTFGRVTELIYDNGGFITNFAGDAFNAIFPDSHSPDRIIGIASEIIDIFTSYSNPLDGGGMNLRMGISTGSLEWAVLGLSKKMYFFKGDALSIATDIQQFGRADRIQFDASFKDILGGGYAISKEKNYFYIDGRVTNPRHEQKRRRKPNEKESLRINALFFPPILSELASDGEFRNVIPVFIRFSKNTSSEKTAVLIDRVIRLSEELGGYVNKLEFGDKGGMLLVIFGAPHAYEDMIERAIVFAQGVRSDTGGTEVSIGMDYGVSYAGFIGNQDWYEYTVLGDIVNTAARISAFSNDGLHISGRILQETDGYVFKSAGKVKLKGKREGEELFTIESKKQTYSMDFISPFVGRENETSKITSFLQKNSRQKANSILLIEGESGTGKTRIAYETVSLFKKRYYYTNADPIIKESMFVLKQFFASVFGFNLYDPDKKKHDSIKDYLDSKFESSSSRFLPYLSSFFSLKETEHQKGLTGKERMETLFYIMKTIISGILQDDELIIIFDDAMWIDEDTHDFLKYLYGYTYEHSLVGIMLFRDDPSVEAKLASLCPEALSIKLTNFTRDMTKEFVKSFFKQETSEELLGMLWEKSEGNPLFLEQIALHMIDNRIIVYDSNMITLKDKNYKIPSSIDRLIVSRLDSLSAVTRDGIQKASVIGKEFEILLLKHLIGEKQIPFVLKEGERNKIISMLSQQIAFFRHILLYETAYKMQFENTLKKIHRQIGQLYEKLFSENLSPYYETLYNHYKRAGIKSKMLHYLRLSIEKETVEYHNESALKLIDELLESCINKREWTEFTLKKGDILTHVGRYEDAFKAYKSAMKPVSKNSSVAAEAFTGIGKSYWAMGKYDDALKNYSKAYAIYAKKRNERGLAEISMEKGIVMFNKGDYTNAVKEYRDGLKHAAKERNLKYEILSNLGLVLFRQGDYSKAMKYYRSALKNAIKYRNLNDQAVLLLRIGLINWEQGRHDEALKDYFSALETNRKIGNRRNEGVTLGNIGMVFNDKGEQDRALDYLFQALNIDKDINNLENESIVLGNIANIYAVKENYDLSLKFYKDALDVDKRIGNKWSEAIDLGNIGQMYKLQKNYKESDKHFRMCIAIIRDMNARHPLAHFLYHRALLQDEMGNFAMSLKFAQEAMDIALEINKGQIAANAEALIKKLKKSGKRGK